MDFLDNLDNTQKILLLVAVITLVVAISVWYRSRDSQAPAKQSREAPPEMDDQMTPLEPGNRIIALFYSPGCGHCVQFHPTWDEFVQNFDGYNGIRLVKINGPENRELLQIHNVGGFPMVKYCPMGLESPEGMIYEGDRTMQSLAQFIQQCN